MPERTPELQEFYSRLLFFSYSSLKMLLWSPAQFKKKYIDHNYPEKLDKYLIDGKVIHCLLLNNHSFEEMFVVSPATLPTGNNKLVIDRVFATTTEPSRGLYTLDWYSETTLEILRNINLHQTLRTDEQRLAKMFTEENNNYFEFLKAKGQRDLIDQATLDRCKEAAEVVSNNPHLRELMGMDIQDFDSDKDLVNETELRADLQPKWSFGLKGILDNQVYDHSNKVIRINDLKTTSKSLDDFQESIEFYKYWLQAVIYTSLVIINNSEFINRGYKVEFRFIVIDSNNQVYPFLVSDKTMAAWFKRFGELLEQAEWHYVNESFDLPYVFQQGLVTL